MKQLQIPQRRGNRWLKNVYETLLDPEIEVPKNISWAAYHANRYQKKDLIVSPSALLPLFHENAHCCNDSPFDEFNKECCGSYK